VVKDENAEPQASHDGLTEPLGEQSFVNSERHGEIECPVRLVFRE
jgi:hypothetical protein